MFPSNIGCAYVEGLADFIGAVGPGAHAGFTLDSLIELNYYFQTHGGAGADGSAWETAVAAFLYDLVDNASFPDGHNNATGDDDDVVSYSGHYLAQVIRTRQQSTLGTSWAPWGIDHIIYCLERTIDPAVTSSSIYFPNARGIRTTCTRALRSRPPGARVRFVPCGRATSISSSTRRRPLRRRHPHLHLHPGSRRRATIRPPRWLHG